MYKGNIDILCTLPRSNYNSIKNVTTWNKVNNVNNYTGHDPVICHPPCSQWSRLRKFSIENKEEKMLGPLCVSLVNKNGGILEHPSGSMLWHVCDFSKGIIISVNQSWWGHQCTKKTLLYFVNCKPLATPITFDCKTKTFSNLSPNQRNSTPNNMCLWLIKSIRETYIL